MIGGRAMNCIAMYPSLKNRFAAALTSAALFTFPLSAFEARAQQATFESSAGELEVRTVARGLANPWALAFLPDGTMLVTERAGRMRIVSGEGQVSPPLKGV